MQPGKRLVGKVAIVTGAASGIGAETARVFAEHGAAVLLTDVSAAAGNAMAKQISDSSGTTMFAEQDVCDEPCWAAIVALAEKNYGRLDILCNIAGISGRDPRLNVQTSPTAGPRLAEQTLEQWNRVMEINATGVFLGTKAAIPAMQRAGGGSIINISSICGLVVHTPTPLTTLRRARCGSSRRRHRDPICARQNPRELGASGLRRHADDQARPFQSRGGEDAFASDPARPVWNAVRHRRWLPLSGF